MNTKEWSQGDRFVDMSGRNHARIVAWANGEIVLLYWSAKTKAKKPMTKTAVLRESFWLSQKCGWRKMEVVNA